MVKRNDTTSTPSTISGETFGHVLRDSVGLGLTTALVFSAFELNLVSISGAHIRIEYQLLALAFYLLVGLSLGTVLAGCIGWLVGRSKGVSERGAGVLLELFHLFGFLCLFGVHLIFRHPLVTSRLVPYQRYAAAGTLVLGAAVIVWVIERILLGNKVERCRFVSYPVGVLVLCILTAGGLYINEEHLPLFFEARSILVNATFVGTLLVGYFLASPLVSRQAGHDVRRGMRFALVPAGIGFGVLITISAHPVERFQMRIPTRRVTATPANTANVILISIDTLRSDHLSLGGYERKTSLNIDTFAAESEVYENAISNSPWTLPAHASMFTGLHAATHGCHFVGAPSAGLGRADFARVPNQTYAAPLRSDLTTLAEILRENSYATGAVVSNSAYLFSAFGLDQGFDYYNDIEGMRLKFEPAFEAYRTRLVGDFLSHRFKWYREAEEINEAVFKWLSANCGGPFFLFVNYNDPHTPYDPPPPYNRLYPGRRPGREYDEWEIKSAVFTMQRSLTDVEKQHFVSQYDGEINYVDHHLGCLFDRLKELGLYDDSMIILIGDHGESFGEHFFVEHGNHLYEPEVRVPLIIKYPASGRVGRVKEYAQPVDILPTVLKHLSLPVGEGIEGRPLGEGASAPDTPICELYVFRDRVVMYGSRFDRVLRSVHLGRYKYIWNSEGKDELYDLVKDPAETKNLAPQLPELVEAGRGSIESRLGPLRPPPKAQMGVADKEAWERLKSVGYIQ